MGVFEQTSQSAVWLSSYTLIKCHAHGCNPHCMHSQLALNDWVIMAMEMAAKAALNSQHTTVL